MLQQIPMNFTFYTVVYRTRTPQGCSNTLTQSDSTLTPPLLVRSPAGANPPGRRPGEALASWHEKRSDALCNHSLLGFTTIYPISPSLSSWASLASRRSANSPVSVDWNCNWLIMLFPSWKKPSPTWSRWIRKEPWSRTTILTNVSSKYSLSLRRGWKCHRYDSGYETSVRDSLPEVSFLLQCGQR